MALLDGDLSDWLISRPEIADYIDERVYLLRAPQLPKSETRYPCIVLSLVSSTAVTSNDGYSDMRFRRVQLDIYGPDLDDVAALGEVVFRALCGFEGFMGLTHVGNARMLTERDLDEEGLEVDEPLFRRSQDWEIAERAE